MDDFEILEHLILPDNTDVCNFVIHSFTTNRNCKKYVLDGVETIIDTSNFQIRYARGEQFKIELYDQILTGNVLSIGVDSIGAIGSLPFFTIDNVSQASIVVARFTYVAITMGAAEVRSFPANDILNVGDFFDLSLNLDNVSGSYDYTELPFTFTNQASESRLQLKMQILSSNIDTLPTPDSVDLLVTLTNS
jgi:hypothetical protein